MSYVAVVLVLKGKTGRCDKLRIFHGDNDLRAMVLPVGKEVAVGRPTFPAGLRRLHSLSHPGVFPSVAKEIQRFRLQAALLEKTQWENQST